MSESQDQAEVEAMWRETLVHGHRNDLAFLPGSPRCTGCLLPLGGMGGTFAKMLGRRSSRKNPSFCNY